MYNPYQMSPEEYQAMLDQMRYEMQMNSLIGQQEFVSEMAKRSLLAGASPEMIAAMGEFEQQEAQAQLDGFKRSMGLK
jgi:hypothetical protein